jgi:hypothetical protein
MTAAWRPFMHLDPQFSRVRPLCSAAMTDEMSGDYRFVLKPCLQKVTELELSQGWARGGSGGVLASMRVVAATLRSAQRGAAIPW